ncbi:transcriptional regulator family: Fungal Specific TF [Paecilomyces variotii]|nr:transcriptional regulator family: Fungal Specific TF [Paecilomyces variotii]KAJ9318155.1 transcriptional regulator family: Fungal Specific TF [Paecilomyces variotii]
MPKVKTGIRRVKCDEEKPACRRCRSSKRKCDGYNDECRPTQSKGRKPRSTYHTPAPRISPDSRLVLRPGTREERQYAELFCTQTSQAIAGFFASEFWCRVLPQLSFWDPAVRHAIIAVSATHEQRILAASSVQQSTVSQTQRNEKLVLEQYNKAIHHLITHSSSPTGGRVEPTLITCCLFIFLEIMRGNFSQALNHVEAGLNIITDLKRRGILDAVDKELVELFVRLNIQKSLFGRPLMTLNAPKADPDSSSCRASFSTISEARVLLDSLTERALKFIRLTKSGQDCSLTTTELLGVQTHITTALDNWSRQFERLTRSKRIKRSDSRGPLILKMQYLVARIWLKTCLSPDEMVFDNHISDFEEIISIATTFINDEATNPQKKESHDSCGSFCGEMGIIPPLYYTALKCREPILRRKAINLISSYHRREGMWEGILYAKVAEFVMAMEEEKQLSLPVEMRGLPASTCRVYEVLIPEEATGNSVRFLLLSKPDGVDGNWYSKTRSILW